MDQIEKEDNKFNIGDEIISNRSSNVKAIIRNIGKVKDSDKQAYELILFIKGENKGIKVFSSDEIEKEFYLRTK